MEHLREKKRSVGIKIKNNKNKRKEYIFFHCII